MRAYDWLLFVTVLSGYCMRGSLQTPVLNVFLRLADCLTKMSARSIDRAELDDLELSVVEFLCLLELVFPHTELTIVYHLLLHVVDGIRKWGPATCSWMFQFERFVGFLCRHIKNRAHVVSNATRFYREFSHVQDLRHSLRPALEHTTAGLEFLQASEPRTDVTGAQRYYEPNGVRLHGESREICLDHDSYKYVCTALRWLQPEYDRLCVEFEADAKAPSSMDDWVPDRVLSPAERLLVGGPNHRVRVFNMVEVHGIDFRSAEWETNRNTRSSYFSFGSIDTRDDRRIEYGRLLQLWEVSFGGEQLAMALVDIYKIVAPETVCAAFPTARDTEFVLPQVDTSRLDRKRHVLPLASLTGQVILAAPDDRLALPPEQRLHGKCLVLQYR